MNTQLAGWAASSNPSTPDDISQRVKGLVLGSSALIIWGTTKFFGITLTAQDVIDLGTYLGAIAGAMWTIYGFGLRLIRWVATKRAPENWSEPVEPL